MILEWSRRAPTRCHENSFSRYILRDNSLRGWTMPRIHVTSISPGKKDGFEETQKLARHWKSLWFITKSATELRLKVILCRMVGLNLGLWSAEEWTKRDWDARRKRRTSSNRVHVQGNLWQQKERNPKRHHHHLQRLRCRSNFGSGWTLHPEVCDEQAFKISKKMTRLFQHGDLPREEDGAVEWKTLVLLFYGHSISWPSWSTRMWLHNLRRGGGKMIFQYCLDPSLTEETILCIRAIQGHSGENTIDPTPQDRVTIRNDFAESIYHVGCSHDVHSNIWSGWIAGGKVALQNTRYTVDQQTGSPEQDASIQGCSLVADLQQNHLYNLFSEKSKRNGSRYGQRGIFRDVCQYMYEPHGANT